jgi:hypothetical protein
MKQTFAGALLEYLNEQLNQLKEWLRPVPDDPIYLKIIKGFLKALVVLLLTALSPVILVILIISFLAAF